MSELEFSKLSEAERKTINEAKKQIIEGERCLAEVILKHLNLEQDLSKAEDFGIHSYPTVLSGNTIRVIRIDGKVVGVYVDPPGVCAAV